MDRRTFLALLLSALVIVVTPILFHSFGPRQSPPLVTSRDTTATASAPAPPTPIATAGQPAAKPAPAVSPPTVPPRPPTDTTSVDAAKVRYVFSSGGGAAPKSIQLLSYANLSATPRTPARATLAATATGSAALPLLRYRLVQSTDTVALDTVVFRADRDAKGITFTSAGTPAVTIRYQFADEGYLAHVSGEIRSEAAAASPAQLLIDLPPTLHSQEADTLDDERHLAYGYKAQHEDVKSVAFGKLDPAFVRTDSGPMEWVAVRNKYFLIALVAPTPSSSFLALRMQGGPRVGKQAPVAAATAIQPVQNGRFAFDLYAGPQSWQQLRAVGHDLENVNPYGGWIPGVQPFATICMRVLLWMRQTFNVSYGWVLIIFGVAVRLLLWPLNQSAMRSSLKMQRLQPELAEVQKRYKTDPEKQREALVKLYQQHGMSPFSPIMGCLPMLLPMPVLFALFFVFQNTIEFRGVSFLWLPDLSLRDPLYIMPLFMGVSMFVLSWIGMRAAPPNPQTKMMSYMMPAVMTMVLLNFASGLNLYYAVQNVAALPQQWLLTRERMKAAVPAPAPAPPLRGRRATT
ncbi:MAG TPA: membrane protein insertase YidC [Gemmatimonadaceae bacterium]|nr:membrane protein insertase YidC [Gemmatimonadaceae bacterium]